MKLSKKILMSLVAITCTGTFYCSAALPIGTNSIAEGNGAISTGKNSTAIGTGAVATGDNLTGDKIKSILKENEENLKRIEELKKQVRETELDFNKKYEIYMRVEAAKKKIEENNKLLSEKLRPELNIANQKYNDFKPGYDKAVNEMNQRLSLISNLDFTLLSRDPEHGLDSLAQELKEKSEQGYDFSNDVSFYKTYIQNYIKAKGDLANNKELYSTITSGYVGEDIARNTLSNSSNYSLWNIFRPIHSGSVSAGSTALDFNDHNHYEINGKKVYMDERTATLSKEELDTWTAKKEEFLQNGLEVINGQKSIFIDETTKQGLKDKLQDQLDYADNIFHAKYEQNCYNKAKTAGDEAEALTHLQKKIEHENKAEALRNKWDSENGKIKEIENHYLETKAAWKKANIDDIENSNTLAINTLRNQYLATLDAQKKKLDELQRAIDKATADIEAKERENRQLKPTPEDEAEAKKAEATKQKLEAEKQALKEALEKLKLNDLTDVGTNALAYGTNALVTGKNAIGIGTEELVTGEDSIGIGRKNVVSGTQSVAIGIENTVTGNNTFVLGSNIFTKAKNAVVLGAGSTGEDNTVSVGSAGKERRIINVAKGDVSKTSTDAINGSQLYELAQNPSTATGMNKENWQQFLGDGTNTSGSKGLVTGDTLYKAIQSIDVTDQIAGKADTDLKNITNDGKTVIKNIAKDSVKVVDGTNTKVTETTDKDGNKNYAVNVEANGKIAENDTGIVNGNTVYQAIKDKADKTDITNAVKDKADVNAGNVTGENKKAWQEKLGDGKIVAGDKGLVNGDTVNNAINNIKKDVDTSLDGKADTDLKNITNDGKTVIKNIAKDSVKVVDGTNTKVTETTDKDGNKNYAVNVEANGKIEKNNNNIVTGGTVYQAIEDKSLVKTDGKTISIDNNGTANVIDVSHTVNGKTEGRIISGVVTDPKNPYSVANVSYVNTSISNVVQEMSSGMKRLEKDLGNAGAGAAALSALEYDEIEPGQKWQIAAGVGNYKGSTAYALGAKYHLNKDISFHVGSTIGNGNNMVNGGFSIALGHAKKKIDNDSMKRLDEMQKEINDLKEQNKQLIQALEKVNKLFLLNPSKKASFPDVPADHWAKNAVDVLHGNGAIEGYPDGTFKGDRNMSRYEYAEMLYNALMNGATVDESVIEKYQPELVQIYSEKNR